jgi:hypothetical protein
MAFAQTSGPVRIRGVASIVGCAFVLLCCGQTSFAQSDPLPSWNAGAAKESILSFVRKATEAGGSDFIPVAERIATFDNDGTLWSEQPMYFQVFFIFDRVKELAPQHPEWKTKQPFQGILAGDMKAALATGEKGLVEMFGATSAGMTTEEFEAVVTKWMATAKHPRFHRPFNELVYQPMLELLSYLRANAFKTYIVSGGGIEFMRPWTERVYGIPPEQVVGSTSKLQYEVKDGQPAILRLPQIDFIDDKTGKPVGIQKHIGRRPVFAAGNSDGDQQMLEWTTAGKGTRFGMIVRHTDDKREWAYDRQSSIGRLDKALDEAMQKKWLVVDMKQDWKVIYPFEK